MGAMKNLLAQRHIRGDSWFTALSLRIDRLNKERERASESIKDQVCHINPPWIEEPEFPLSGLERPDLTLRTQCR